MPTFCDRDGRPAVLFSLPDKEALAMLKPGGFWEPVDALDVAESGRVVGSAEALEAWFASTFGPFTVPSTFSKDGFASLAGAE